MATIYKEEIYLAEFRDITEENSNRRNNSLEIENDKVKAAIETTNNKTNLHITTGTEDASRLLTGMSVFSKIDSTSFTVDNLTRHDSRKKLREKLPYSNGNSPFTNDSFKFLGLHVYLKQKTNYSAIYSSPQVKFKKLKSKNYNDYEIPIGYYDIKITNIQSNSLLLNSPLNIINKSTDSSDRVTPMNRFTPSDTFQQAFGNSRIILENQNRSENYIFSTSPDLIKIGLTKRQLLFKESNKQTVISMNRDFSFKQDKIKVVPLDHHSYQSSKIKQGNTLHIYVNSKNSKTGVLAAIMLLNTSLPFLTEIYSESTPIQYYINNVYFNQTQRYDNCVIYSVDPVLTSSQLVTFNKTDIDVESIDDLYSFLSISTGNAEDQQFSNNIVTNFMTLQELHKKGVHITVPMQSYPQPIGMFVSTNSSNIQNILETENINILHDYHLYSSLMLSKDLYISIKIKKFLTTDTYGIIREQSTIQMDQYLKEFYKNPFTISNTLTLSIFPNLTDKLIKITSLNTRHDNSEITNLSYQKRSYHNCLYYRGGTYDLATWTLCNEITGFSKTKMSSVLLSCEEIESRKLVTHYDIDDFMQLIHNDYLDDEWLGMYEFKLFTNSNSSYIEDNHFETISANHGLFVQLKIDSITTSSCEDASYVISFSDTPNINKLNKMQNKIGVDLSVVEDVKNDIYNVIKLSKNKIINSPNLSEWINTIAYNIVSKSIKYKYEHTENDEIKMVFYNGDDISYIEMLNSIFSTNYIIKPGKQKEEPKTDVQPEIVDDIDSKIDDEQDNSTSTDEDDIGSGNYDKCIDDDDEEQKFMNDEDNIGCSIRDIREELAYFRPIRFIPHKSDTSINEEQENNASKEIRNLEFQQANEVVGQAIFNEIMRDNLIKIPTTKTGINNCVHDALVTIIPKGLQKRSDVKKDLEFVKANQDYYGKNKKELLALLMFARKHNLNMKLFTHPNQDGEVKYTSYGRLFNEKFLYLKRTEEGMHMKAYMIRDQRLYLQTLMYAIQENDLWKMKNKHYPLITDYSLIQKITLDILHSKDSDVLKKILKNM